MIYTLSYPLASAVKMNRLRDTKAQCPKTSKQETPRVVKAVFLDMDNTLIETQQIYIDGQNRFADFIQSCGVHEEADKIVDRLLARQIEIFDRFAYGKELLPQAYEDTLKHFVPDATDAEIKRVRDMAYDVYATEAKIKPGAHEALITMKRAGLDLYLITVGDIDVQQNRVAALPFKNLFTDVFIVSDKNAAVYAGALLQAGVKGEDAVMIGDSLKSDIVPARKNGMQAIHIPAQNWHGREMAGQTLPEGAVSMPDILTAARDIADKYGEKQQPKAPARRAGGHKPR